MVAFQLRIFFLKSEVSRPVFGNKTYEVNLSEKAEVGTVILKMMAWLNRTEGGSSSPLTYLLHSAESPESAKKFKVSKVRLSGEEFSKLSTFLQIEPRSSHILLVERLDYEVCREHRLTIEARHRQLSNFAEVVIKVQYRKIESFTTVLRVTLRYH